MDNEINLSFEEHPCGELASDNSERVQLTYYVRCIKNENLPIAECTTSLCYASEANTTVRSIVVVEFGGMIAKVLFELSFQDGTSSISIISDENKLFGELYPDNNYKIKPVLSGMYQLTVKRSNIETRNKKGSTEICHSSADFRRKLFLGSLNKNTHCRNMSVRKKK